MRGKDAVRALLESPEPGTHAILWHDDSEDGDGAILAFLRGAIRRSDLTLVVLPRTDLDALTDRMRARGMDFDALVDQGHIVRAAFEDLAPHRVSDLASSRRDLEALREFARSVGKKGLSIIGRTAPIYFENGEGAMAA
ncbi:MAG TPA: MEDS domain-containing protein, partial [Thermoplasmata archaeon]|nr:MEDS domain-containing protein [Thermoplasmata archaeon]